MKAKRIFVETGLAPSPVSAKDARGFRRAILRWYDKSRRDLPWRRTRDPYRIWLSEIMLQQTRVAAVLEHYRVFLERFPTVEALAAAPLELVLAAWSGLGYYRRARMLHQCAQEIALKQRGHFPKASTALRALPGIGRYTAAAIASIAFDEPAAVVDGNVERVIERLNGRGLQQHEIWRQAQSLLQISRPGDFNQAMMELGATICLPREPNCPACPVRQWCASQSATTKRRAPRRQAQGKLPRGKAQRRQLKKEVWCTLAQRDGHIRLVQRDHNSSLMPGMWELPQRSEPPSSIRKSWRTFRHSITVTDYTVRVLRKRTAPQGQWIRTSEISNLPLTGLTRKILRAGGVI